MGAFAGLVVLAYLGGGSLHGARAGQLIIGGLAGLALAGPSLLAAWWIPKGPYLIYGLSAGVAMWLLVNGLRRQTPPAPALVTALLVWTALNAVLVCVHWGEGARVPEALLAAGMVLAVLVTQSASPRPCGCRNSTVCMWWVGCWWWVVWSSARWAATTGSRLAATGDDLYSRTTHFAHGLGMVRGLTPCSSGLGWAAIRTVISGRCPTRACPVFWRCRAGRASATCGLVVSVTRPAAVKSCA
jgi:hypothetical protein